MASELQQFPGQYWELNFGIKCDINLIPKDRLKEIGERYFNVFSPKHPDVSKALANKFESLQKEVPNYQFDKKCKQIVEKSQLISICGAQPTYHLKENGLFCDKYLDEKDLEGIDDQDYHENDETLRNAFPDATIIRDQQFSKLEKDVLVRKELNIEFTNNYSVVPFQMPDKFEYTGAIMVNNLFEGLLHTFVRNWKKWSQLIPELENTIDKLSSIRSHLEKIQKTTTLDSTGRELNKLSDKLSKIDPLTFLDVKLALLEAQLQIHKYLEQIINSKDCSPTHKKGNYREHFELPDKSVLNICTSKQPYPEVHDFGSRGIEERPIRVIRTVIFNDTPIDQIQETISPLNHLEIKKDDDHQNEHEHENKLDRLIDLEAQTGINGDCYEIDDILPDRGLKDEELQLFKTNRANQKVEEECLGKSDPNVKVISDGQLKELKDDVSESRDCLDKIKSQNLLLHLKMPPEFEYTTAIMANEPMQGLEHSFIRHWDQWQMHIPTLSRTLKKLLPIQTELDEVNDAENHGIAKVAIDKLKDKLGKLPAETLKNVQLALFEAQMQIHEFIQANITSENYLNEGVNCYRQIHTYFKIPDQDQLLVVGVSQQLFPAVDEFSNDKRPVHFVTTAYFMDRVEYHELLIKYKSSFKKFAKVILTRDAKQKTLETHRKQVPQSASLKKHYEDTKQGSINLLSKKLEYSKLQTGFGEGNNPDKLEKKFLKQFNKKNWLFVTMPKKLRYTCVIMLNGIEEGLLHTMVRHTDQWSNYIDNFKVYVSEERLNANLAKIFDTIFGLKDGTRTYETDKKTAYANYYNAIASIFDAGQLRDIRRNLLIAQMKIYNFILENTHEKIFEEDVTKKGRVRVLFKVPIGIDVVKRMMALGVSNELYPFIDEYDDKRPVRTIATVYFVGENFYDEPYDDDDSHWINIMTCKQIDAKFSKNNKHIPVQSDFKMKDDEFPALG